MRRRRYANLSPMFGVKEEKCLIRCISANEALELRFAKQWKFSESRPEHDIKFTRLYDLLPTGNNLWHHFRSKCKDHEGNTLHFEVDSSNNVRDIKKKIIPRRQQRRRRTSTIALSENAFVFSLKREMKKNIRYKIPYNLAIFEESPQTS